MRGARAGVLLALACAFPARASVEARLEVAPVKAKIGDALAATIVVTASAGEAVDEGTPATTWGEAEVLGGRWEPVEPGSTKRTWKGTIAVYRLGAVTIPPVEIGYTDKGKREIVTTQPVPLTIEGSIAGASGADASAPIADLKPQASIAPDYGPVRQALAILAALLAVAGVAWWLWRRYAAKLRAAAIPPDPFRRLAPHVWAYEELRKLLERRLAEEGKFGLFYDELTRILKTYLEGRYRVDLLERTTGEVSAALTEAGAPPDAVRLARAILEAGDLVKFARVGSEPAACRAAVDDAYRLVDRTKPVETPAPAAAGAGASA